MTRLKIHELSAWQPSVLERHDRRPKQQAIQPLDLAEAMGSLNPFRAPERAGKTR